MAGTFSLSEPTIDPLLAGLFCLGSAAPLNLVWAPAGIGLLWPWLLFPIGALLVSCSSARYGARVEEQGAASSGAITQCSRCQDTCTSEPTHSLQQNKKCSMFTDAQMVSSS